ncbi:hypothetical protein E2C01_074216 [Portunus trituberculatus]|uniref:Uncharacterized protein n=1 Tax=Portunus trituberculatus TaxID=210409 RepID=A0A5B7ICN2_PORTR|nr:hypothetical protein [Portunus trituberculatus]
MRLVGDVLQPFNYKRKASTLLVFLVVLKVPGFFMTVLGNYGHFPCVPPYITSMMYAHNPSLHPTAATRYTHAKPSRSPSTAVVSLVHLCLIPLFGGLEYWQYHTLEFVSPISDKHHKHSHELIIHGQACVCIISEMNVTKPTRRLSGTLPPIVLENKMALDPQYSSEEGQNNNDGVANLTSVVGR